MRIGVNKASLIRDEGWRKRRPSDRIVKKGVVIEMRDVIETSRIDMETSMMIVGAEEENRSSVTSIMGARVVTGTVCGFIRA
jgi:hypothetical protein